MRFQTAKLVKIIENLEFRIENFRLMVLIFMIYLYISS